VDLDASTLGDLFEIEGRSLLRYAARRTCDPDLALDLVGETFAIAFERRAKFRGTTRPEAVAWLYAICRTVIHHHFRRGGAELRALERLGVQSPTLPDEERLRIEELASLEELRAVVGTELSRLPRQQRRAVELRVVAELSYDEVADALGVTPQTARARVSRGLRALARGLQLEELADAS
jgi:RNA polymerase sigma-70 factor (ECF subfamily)